MTTAGAEYRLSRKVDDVAAAGVVGVLHVLAELVGAQIPKHGDFAPGFRLSDVGKLVQRQTDDAKAGPALSGSREHFGFGRLLFADRAECVCNTCRTAA